MNIMSNYFGNKISDSFTLNLVSPSLELISLAIGIILIFSSNVFGNQLPPLQKPLTAESPNTGWPIKGQPQSLGPDQFVVSWVELTRPWSAQLIARYLSKSDAAPLRSTKKTWDDFPDDSRDTFLPEVAKHLEFVPLAGKDKNKVKLVYLPVETNRVPNPLRVVYKDFDVGTYLPWPTTVKPGPFPMPSSEDTKWFNKQLSVGMAPSVFVIGGHHVISEGFHNDAESRFLFEPVLFKLSKENQAVNEYFGQVKLAIVWGCNTLTNLEPHHVDGAVMAPEEIQKLYESSPVGKLKVLGLPTENNTLEFYKTRLAREYGPHSHEYAYTRDVKNESCKGPIGPYFPCEVANLERILPDAGLFDGTHRYNEAFKMNTLFKNAYLVLGFASASPSEELRVQILQSAIMRANQKLKLVGTENVVEMIVNPGTPENLRQAAVVALRDEWEYTSFKMNRNRPAGSITPKYPHIDGGYVSHLHLTNDPQMYAKFR